MTRPIHPDTAIPVPSSVEQRLAKLELLLVIPNVNGTTIPLTGVAWTAPTLINSWVNVGGAGVATAGYLKDPFGFVRLRGLVVGGANGAAAFTLPETFRPGGTDFYGCGVQVAGGAPGYGFVYITKTGTVAPYYGGTLNALGLSGISFLAEN